MTEKERLQNCFNEIVKLKNKGLLNREIAEIYNTSVSNITRLFANDNIVIRPKFNDSNISEIIKLYDVKNVSIYKIAKEYHITDKRVSEILKEYNIHIKTMSECKQIYILNEKYFDNIDNKDKAYWLGWLWSDGHNHTDNNQIIIQIQENDGYILEQFNKDIESNRPIKSINMSDNTDFNRKNQKKIVISNKHMSESLLNLGMIHDKSLKATFPKIQKELYSHFIRGYMDGDGWISKNPSDCRMNFTGTVFVCEAIQNILKEELNVNSYLTIPHGKIDKPTRTLIVAGKNQVKKVLDYIYENSDNHYLVRKYEIYQNIYM